MIDQDAALIAIRLIGVSAAVLLLPGLLLLRVLDIATEWHHRIVLAFSISYSWIFALSIVIPLCGWSVDVAGGLTALVVAGLGTAAVIRAREPRHVSPRSRGDRAEPWLATAAVIGCAAFAWLVEPPFTGEEALDLASLWRFADGGPITFQNTSLMPDALPVYLFQPYQLALGLIARWSGTEPLVAFVKFRAFLAPLALVLFYSLVRWLAPTRVEARAAFGVVLLFVLLDINTWEWNSLFPFVRRGGVAAGVCVPALMVLILAATRQAIDAGAARVRLVALATVPVMFAASLSTHPLEMFPVLCFAAAAIVAVVLRLDQAGSRRQVLLLALILTTTAGAYLSLHARTVRYVAEYERDNRQSSWDELVRLSSNPGTAIDGPTESREILTRSLPQSTATVFGVPALALVVLRAPATAVLLALATIPLALVYATPAGFTLLKLLTSSETAMDVNAYFGLLGLLGLALGLTSVTQAALSAAAWRRRGIARVFGMSAAGSVAAWVVWTWTPAAVRDFAERVITHPGLLALTSALVLLAVVAIAQRRRTLVPAAPFPMGVILMTTCLAVPFAVPDWGFGGVFSKRLPLTALDRYEASLATPSVLDWPRFYDALRNALHAELPARSAVVDELRSRIPPREVVLAHPRYSCPLAVLLDAYCINPEKIYGHYYQPAAPYFAKYVRQRDDEPSEHPFFNPNASLSEAERRLLREYHVSYVLTDPEHAEQTAGKLEDPAIGATLLMERDGYRLYRINGS